MHVNIIHCNGTLRTAIVFNCNSSAVWNPTQTDVTNFVKDFLWDEITDPCLVSSFDHTPLILRLALVPGMSCGWRKGILETQFARKHALLGAMMKK